MTDPHNPAPDAQGHTPGDAANQPPAPPAYGTPTTPPPAYGAPAYSAPAYPNAPAYSGGTAPNGTTPGRTLGIVALILAIVPIGLQLVGLILGIVGLVQSKKAGQKNGLALAAIIVSSVLIVIGIIVGIMALAAAATLANDIAVNCGTGGSGYVEIWGQDVPCTQIDSGTR